MVWKKIKLISVTITIVSCFFTFMWYADQYMFGDNEDYTLVVQDMNEHFLSATTNIQLYSTGNLLSLDSHEVKKLVKILPEEIVIKVYFELVIEEIDILLYNLKELDHKQIISLAELFKHLSPQVFKKLIRLSDKLTDQKFKLLVDLLISLNIDSQISILNTLTKLSLVDVTNLLEFLNELTRPQTEALFKLIDKASNKGKIVNVIISLPRDILIDLVNSFKHFNVDFVDRYVDIVDDLSIDNLILAMKIFIRFDHEHRTKLIEVLDGGLVSDRNSAVSILFNISKEHAQRAIDLVYEDRSIYRQGINLSNRLVSHLGEEGYDTIERSINTAARVDKDTRKRGLEIMDNDVRVYDNKRIMKQVDGQRGTYTDNTIEQLVEDYDTVYNKQKFISILAGSEGVRLEKREVTQERKLLRVRGAYHGNLQHRKEFIIEHFDKVPVIIKKLKEDDFPILPPEELNKVDDRL